MVDDKMAAMVLVRCLVFASVVVAACGNVIHNEAGDAGNPIDAGNAADSGGPGDAAAPIDAAADLNRHLQVAANWSIEPLVDLTAAGFTFNASDFNDGSEVRSNQPTYVAALYPPFSTSLAVLAGRSVIEVGLDLKVTVRGFAPDPANGSGPDAFGRAAVANLGTDRVGLWVTSASSGGGDGLFLIDDQWALASIDTTSTDPASNNTYALGVDADGTFDAVGGPALYVATESLHVQRQTTQLAHLFDATAAINDLAFVGTSLFMTIEASDAEPIVLERVASKNASGNYVITQLSHSMNIVLAEGSTAARLLAIVDNSTLATVSPSDGKFTNDAWSDDPDWTWSAVTVPRQGHGFEGQVIVLESNRKLNRDRLLRVTPPL